MTRIYALALGAGTQVFVQGIGNGYGTSELTTDLSLGAGLAINLAVRAVQSDAVSRDGGDEVGRIRGALDGRLDAAAERLDAAASLARADSLRTAEVLRLCRRAEAKGSQASDLRNCGVPRLV